MEWSSNKLLPLDTQFGFKLEVISDPAINYKLGQMVQNTRNEIMHFLQVHKLLCVICNKFYQIDKDVPKNKFILQNLQILQNITKNYEKITKFAMDIVWTSTCTHVCIIPHQYPRLA